MSNRQRRRRSTGRQSQPLDSIKEEIGSEHTPLFVDRRLFGMTKPRSSRLDGGLFTTNSQLMTTGPRHCFPGNFFKIGGLREPKSVHEPFVAYQRRCALKQSIRPRQLARADSIKASLPGYAEASFESSTGLGDVRLRKRRFDDGQHIGPGADQFTAVVRGNATDGRDGNVQMPAGRFQQPNRGRYRPGLGARGKKPSIGNIVNAPVGEAQAAAEIDPTEQTSSDEVSDLLNEALNADQNPIVDLGRS